MQQIYKRTPMSKCDFNKVAKQLIFYFLSFKNQRHCFSFEDMLQLRKTLSKLLEFCSILFHFALFSVYSTGSLLKIMTNTLNFNNLEKSSWKCLWIKFTWVLKRCQIQPTFIMTTCNATQNSAVLGYFWTSIFTDHHI